MSRCENCGTRLRLSGACPNCQEELVIFEEQYEDLPPSLSNQFTEKVKEQREERKRRRES